MRYRITIETDNYDVTNILNSITPGDHIRVEVLEDVAAASPPKKSRPTTNRNKRYGKQQGWDTKQDAKLMKLKAQGKSTADIAAAMGRTIASVQSRNTKLNKEAK